MVFPPLLGAEDLLRQIQLPVRKLILRQVGAGNGFHFGHGLIKGLTRAGGLTRDLGLEKHLPKIGDVCFLGKPNFGLSFSWRKIALPVDGGKFRSPLSQDVFLKNRKNRRAIKTEFSVLI